MALGTDAKRDEVRAAARAAAADEFVSHLPLGYYTPLEQAPMSGGERQRLGLARAALRRARVLVLDDATSSLDTATEARVLDSLAALASGRTTIVIAHRASTAARADLVAWLVDGRIARLAPHAELWSDPAYRTAFAQDQDAPA
jgi:ATP-binding cassette subfamily B protein